MPIKIEEKLIERYGIIDREIPISNLDISETISELSYLTHSHFRYYGKFPSKLAAHFLDQFVSNETVFLDNYAGSGTSLVEAMLRGVPSYGVDINPLAVLACNVKTTIYSESELTSTFEDIKKKIDKYKLADLSRFRKYIPEWSNLNKWFDPDAVKGLAVIKKSLLETKFKTEDLRDFFWLGYFGIVRRISNAHDAEIRPHVNTKKKKRNVYEAYSKKMVEMIENSVAFEKLAPRKNLSKTYLGSNTNLSNFSALEKRGVNLVLSHPPYLNCFDYIPVYNLEFQWALDIPFVWQDLNLKTIKKLETKSWPATSEKILYGYFDENKKVYEEVYKILKPGGVCGIVIGDSTINKELIRVHKILASICENIGFELSEIIYRTTHYGAGKYAYKDRANYHGDDVKKDGILVLKKAV